jgi:hypothetical protein
MRNGRLASLYWAFEVAATDLTLGGHDRQQAQRDRIAQSG